MQKEAKAEKQAICRRFLKAAAIVGDSRHCRKKGLKRLFGLHTQCYFACFMGNTVSKTHSKCLILVISSGKIIIRFYLLTLSVK